MSSRSTALTRSLGSSLNALNSLARARGAAHPALTLAVIVTCQLMLILDASVVNIALPQMQHDLGISATDGSWMLSAYMLTFGGLLLLGGRVGDIYGRRVTFIGGLALFTLASLLGGLATSATMLIALRAVQGIGAAFAAPSALALLATTFAEGEPRNRALSIFGAAASAGGSIGMLLGGALTALANWRWVFFINVPVGLVVIAVAWLIVNEPERRPGRLDLLGALLVTLGMASLVYGFIRAASDGWGDPLSWGAFVVAVALLGLFLFAEMRVSQPIMPLRLFAHRNRAGAYINILLVPATMFGVFFFLTQFLQNVLGMNPLIAGLAFLPMTLTMFTTVRLLPRLLPIIGAKPMAVASAVLLVVGIIWLGQLSASSTYLTGILGPSLVLGLGMGSANLPLSVIVLSGVQRDDSGIASGALQTMQQVGASLGVAILVTIFGMASRAAATHPVLHASAAAQGRAILVTGVQTAFRWDVIFPLAALAVAVIVIQGVRATRSHQGDSSSAEQAPIELEADRYVDVA